MGFPWLLILAVLTAQVFCDVRRPQFMNDTECGCFVTNGTEPGFYAKHLFFDFRRLSQFAGASDVIPDETLASIAGPGSDYFAGDDWSQTWQLQGWNNSKGGNRTLSGDATVLMVNSPSNVYIETDDQVKRRTGAPATFMTMRTKRLDSFQTAAELQSQDSDYQFLSLRLLARVVGDPGAVAGVFTYRDASNPADVQEADLEILTSGPRDRVQYTNQPSSIGGEPNPAATRNATMPRGRAWSEWAVHRLDWTPRRSVWYVDGGKAASIAFQVPRNPSSVHINSWGNGGSWSGNMSVNGEARLQVRWIEIVYNTTADSSRSGSHLSEKRQLKRAPRYEQMASTKDGPRGCRVACSIDETSETGRPVKLWESRANRPTPSWGLAWVLSSALAHWAL
ncbi:hypothetical protein HIM_07713 [Hirsutella minnesotensis 3608]|uniref:GH16 domain-containing protein n=1 Tax=Hirsutella minnesotensis 3608 TaxID=1043627 RepID=A0A0F7ZN13_9HYPO|nr:hypothetical protein HIM_07713 [Hirsutella minnesotensis 3608]